MRPVPFLAFAALLLVPSAASAHRMLIAARVSPSDPNAVRVEARYDGPDDNWADKAKVTLTDATGAVVAEGVTDEHGACVLRRPGPGTYTVAVDDGAGHRAALTLADDEAHTDTRNRWLMTAVGLAVIAAGTLAAWWLRRRSAVV